MLQFNEEMLTAYLDDELSSEERRVVEKTISEDPRSAQLFKELQDVRAAVQALPPLRPAKDPVLAVRNQIDRAQVAKEAKDIEGSGGFGRWMLLVTAACLLFFHWVGSLEGWAADRHDGGRECGRESTDYCRTGR